MNEVKNYPWHNKFQIPEKNLEKWRNSSSKKSLTFYALKNRLINKKDYFEWAVDHYQTPKINDMYFEQNLMKKDTWNQVKDTYDWTEEVLPIAFWNNTIFIGCVELNDKVPKKILGFDSRIVLTSQKSLEVIWSFYKTLSDIIEKTLTGFDKESSLLKIQSEEPSQIKPKESLNPLKLSTEKNFKQEKLKGTFDPDLPIQKKNYPPPVLQSSSEQDFPEEERIRNDSSDETFPGRSFPQEGEDSLLFMKRKKESAFEKNKDLLVDTNQKVSHTLESKKESGLKLVENSIPSAKNVFKSPASKLKSGISNETTPIDEEATAGFSRLKEIQNYNTLWDYAKKHYCSSIIFNVEGDKAYLDSFTGKVKIKSEDNFYIDFKDQTLFKIVQRGYPYNGFVVESPANKKLFADLGWNSYPQYTTAIPIKDSEDNLKKIFLGFSLKNFSKQEIQNIQKDILDIFHKRKLSRVA